MLTRSKRIRNCWLEHSFGGGIAWQGAVARASFTP